MSICTVDVLTYSNILNAEVARLLNADRQLDLIAARQLAQDTMAVCFRCDAHVWQSEHQLDMDEYAEEMSIGGLNYKPMQKMEQSQS